MTAAGWLVRWDAQQETYLPDREERFDVVIDLVEAVGGAAPRVLDLGCGPGSLSARLLARLPAATVVGVDADPVLLQLAGWSAPVGLTLVDVDLRDPAWAEAIPPGPYDAVVSTTALHWLSPATLRDVYRACGWLLRPGGLLANGDNFRVSSTPRLLSLALELDRRRSARHGGSGERWGAWWEAVLSDPTLKNAIAERARRAAEHPSDDLQTDLAAHEGALRAAGFDEVGVLWRKGTDCVLAAVSHRTEGDT
jgi:SAM-dependent methyltransferase